MIHNHNGAGSSHRARTVRSAPRLSPVLAVLSAAIGGTLASLFSVGMIGR